MSCIDKCIDDALNMLSPQIFTFETDDGPVTQSNSSLMENECEIYVWPQTWGSTAGGFGGIGGQMITSSLTTVVIGPNQDACVYHGGRLAYKIDEISDHFRECVNTRSMPGQRGPGRGKLTKKAPKHVNV